MSTQPARAGASLAPLLLTILACGASLPAQSGWSKYTGNEPPGRAWHGMAGDPAGASVMMFGGWSGGALNDTWEWNGQAWRQRSGGSTPSGRCCFAIAYDAARQVAVLFGGTSSGSNDLADTWEWSSSTGWRQRNPTTSPSARRLCRMAYDPVSSRVILFGGGQTGFGVPVFSDTWAWDGTNWNPLAPANSPDSRWYHSMTTDWRRSRIVLFGGTDTAALGGKNDIWEWDGTDWSQIGAPGGPVKRHDAGMSYDPRSGEVLLYGGWDGTQYFRDTWAWNGAMWRSLGVTPGPTARRGVALGNDLGGNQVLAFGGFDSSYLGETWLHRGTVRATYGPFGAGCAGSQGTPALDALSGQSPKLGSNFNVAVTSLPRGAASVMFLGSSRTLWGSQNLPVDLTSIGMNGCNLLVSPDVDFSLSNSNGSAVLPLPIPNNPFLIGFEFYNQAFVLDPGANTLGITASNGGVGRIGAQ